MPIFQQRKMLLHLKIPVSLNLMHCQHNMTVSHIFIYYSQMKYAPVANLTKFIEIKLSIGGLYKEIGNLFSNASGNLGWLCLP